MALGTPVSRGTAKRFVQDIDISTGTFTPAADELLLCYIRTNGGTGGPDAVLGHDGGSSWVQLGSTEVSSGQSYHLFGCHSGASPSSDDVTVQNSTSGLMTMTVVSVTGADVSGTVANSFDQSAQNSAYTTNMTLTLTGATSLTMGFWGTNSNMVQTPEGTQLNTVAGNYNSTQLTTDYDSSGDASPSCTNASIQHSAFFAVEVKEAAAGGNTLAADSGSYTYTGTAAGLLADRVLSVDSGTYTYTGTDVNLIVGALLSADSGSYAYSGTSVDLLKGSAVGANSGTYTYTGTDATLTFASAGNFTLVADTGAYTYIGTNVDLLQDRILIADSGVYTYTGTNVDLMSGFIVQADSGAYVYSGTAIDFIQQRILSADSGSYVYNGTDANIFFSPVPPDVPVADGLTVSGTFGDGVAFTASFGTGATVKGKL